MLRAKEKYKDEKKREGVERLRLLGFYEEVARDLSDLSRLYYSEQTPIGAFLYPIPAQCRWMPYIRDYEKQSGRFVYHVIHCYLDIGEVLYLLSVASDTSMWDQERDEILKQKLSATMLCLTPPRFSMTVLLHIISTRTGILLPGVEKQA